MGDVFQGEALPDGEADGDGRVEVAAGGGAAGDDCEGNANGKGPADQKEGAESSDAEGAGAVEGEGRDGSDAGEDVEEDTDGLVHAFSENTGSSGFEVEFALRDGFSSHDLAGDMLLEGIGHTKFQVVGGETCHMVPVCHSQER